ncbi:Helicase C-terminal domain-containing protein [Mycena kentingensis (nom. inval.)]|nr:Helicase C-terminal domain-containing protein [Mycena kentingensis (nom. inval.)]
MQRTSTSPWSLANYMAYGSLALDVVSAEPIQSALSQDDWLPFVPEVALNCLVHEADDALVHALKFLAQERFIAATYRSVSSVLLVVRVYVVPYDLPGSRGELRRREDRVLKTAKPLLSDLFMRLDRSAPSWAGETVPKIPSSEPGVTLSGLYEDLPSPAGSITDAFALITRRLLDFDDPLDNLGLISKLWHYQRQSVAEMIQREIDLSSQPDPLFLPCQGMDGRQFYFQPGTMEVLLERPQVEPCRGGMLCEELGTGKTVISLALILATRNQLSTPQFSCLDTRPVLTPLAARYFTAPDFDTARARFPFTTRKRAQPRVPSLIELCLHKLATQPVEFVPQERTDALEDIRQRFESLEHYAGPLRDNIPFYLEFQRDPVDNERGNRRGSSKKQPGPFKLYLTTATLVVVPPNLLLQWTKEIAKHCEAGLRVCALQGTEATHPMPSARELAFNYDIVLMTYPRFTAEAKRTDLKTRVWKGCKCPEYGHVRVPQCTCKPPTCSPLLLVRWKRLIIDEGHVSATLDTVLTPFTQTLSVERRWIVTGTPTTNLLGLNLGKSTSASNGEMKVDLLESTVPALEATSASIPADDLDSDEPLGPRIWTREDGEDVKKLGNMLAFFVGVPQLLATPSLIETHVREPLLNGRGVARKEPRLGAVEVLKQLMASTMIRHRIADVELEVKIPTFKHELVLLDLHPLAVKSYNALQAVIAINAISSERMDKDYMFHAMNEPYLREAVGNMSQILFWSVDDNFYNAVDNISDGGVALRRKLKPTTSSEDVKLMNGAIKHLEIAFDDPLWRAVQYHADIPYEVKHLAKPIFDVWSRTVDPVIGGDASVAGVIHIGRLLKLRKVFLFKPLIAQDGLLEIGREVTKDEERQASLMAKAPKSTKGQSGHGPAAQNDGMQKAKALQAVKDASGADAIREMQLHLLEALGDEPEMGSGTDAKNTVHIPKLKPSPLIAQSLIGQTRVGMSASSKLNFIVSEVLKYSQEEKFLIFSESVLTLAHIGEALQLIGVDYLRFSTAISAEARKQFVLTFETSATYRVFLMELKHGARGLNLTAASRIIFCEPVWRPDVESQAIKRCHRIGQTRPITVKTLAIRSTPEEAMSARRKIFKDGDKVPKLLDEVGFRAFIANPKFLPQSSSKEIPTFDIPLVKIPPSESDDVEMSGSHMTPSPSSRSASAPQFASPPPLQRRTTFADEGQTDSAPSATASPSKRQKLVHFASPTSPSPPRKKVSFQIH